MPKKKKLFSQLTIIICLAFSGLFLSLNKNSFAAEGALFPIQSLHVAQENSSSDGVLIARPKPLDKKIVDIIDLYQINSLEDYSQWLGQNIKYNSDKTTDTWSVPLETLDKKQGDCEDFAFLTMEFIRVVGFKPHFLALVRKKKAHAICTFKHNGYYAWFDNEKLKTTQTTSLDEFAKHIADNYDYSTLMELNPQTKQWNIMYDKS